MNTEEKNILPNYLRLLITIGSLVSILLTFNQCTIDKGSDDKPLAKATPPSVVPPKTSIPSSPSSPYASHPPLPSTGDSVDHISDAILPDGLVMPPLNAPTPDSELDELDVGVKNFEQIYLSMATVTGITPMESKPLGVYRGLVTQMPSGNDLKSFLVSNQVAIIKVASEFCEKLVSTQELRVVIWPSIDFTKGANVVFTAANKKIIIDAAIDSFMPPLDSATKTITHNELAKLFDDLLIGEVLTSNATTNKIVKGICIATLSSAYVTLL